MHGLRNQQFLSHELLLLLLLLVTDVDARHPIKQTDGKHGKIYSAHVENRQLEHQVHRNVYVSEHKRSAFTYTILLQTMVLNLSYKLDKGRTYRGGALYQIVRIVLEQFVARSEIGYQRLQSYYVSLRFSALLTFSGCGRVKNVFSGSQLTRVST